MLDINAIRAQIASIVQTEGGDPALALAVAEDESGFNPTIRGDSGHSVGLFQENDQGAGYGKTFAERADVVGSTTRFVDRIKRVIASGFTGTPGEIAAAAQRPADPAHYANVVDQLYAKYHDGTVISGGGADGSVAGDTCGLDGISKLAALQYLHSGKTPEQVAAEMTSRLGRTITADCVRNAAATALVPVPDVVGALTSGIGGALAALAIPVAIIIVVLFLSAKGVDRATS